MPRFSVTFGRRKSTADNLDNAPVTPSFRVLERSEVAGAKQVDGGVKPVNQGFHRPTGSDVTFEDNIFADLKPNRGSGSSNTTKTTLTDISSRHSNASTTPSSTDMGGIEDSRGGQKKLPSDVPVPPIPKSSATTGFLRAAGRTFSFGGQKKHQLAQPTITESPPATSESDPKTPSNGRSRAATTSTTTTLTPPRVDSDFELDLGGDFGKLVLGSDHRSSVVTLKNDQYSVQAPAPRSLTGSRPNQPSPLQFDNSVKVDPPLRSWSSQHSNDQLIAPSPTTSPAFKDNAPAVSCILRESSPITERPRPGTSPEFGSRKPALSPQQSNLEQEEDAEDEETRLLKDSLSTVTKFLNGTEAPMTSGTTYRRDGSTLEADSDSLFDSTSSRYGSRYTSRKHQGPPTTNKVMTPAEFERYRRDKEQQDRERREHNKFSGKNNRDEDEEDNYEDDEDDLEKARQQAKQRQKQEAHLAVYRQQMMKVTGESSSRLSIQMSSSTPALTTTITTPAAGPANGSDNSDEDEDIPLAVLAAHGFPNKNRPPNRLSTMMSNPNLRAAQQPSYQRPGSAIGDVPGVGNARLPAFARNLPQDPFIGAGLIRNPVRESFSLGGGAPGIPPGGLIGVIANEERNRAMRRGSPHLEGPTVLPYGSGGLDPVTGIPSHQAYQGNRHSMMQMNQQMQQFMQMQMQFMQTMMANQQNAPMASVSATNLNAMGTMQQSPGMLGVRMPEARHSFIANDSRLDIPFGRGEAQMRTMSMVQPSSASWIQPGQPVGYAPSIRPQGNAYAPSIAPSERSNIGLPGRYRPVSHMPPPHLVPEQGHLRKSSVMSGAPQHPSISVTNVTSDSGNASDDDEEGWAAMKAKREKKKSLWRSKKLGGDNLDSLIS
ncbi:uncharacterized protein CTHT_0010220 [Thermochaetoides thermophila DSM 1495]|uniref:Uncharacterized protein n=1 Tax=Chaetomium thermophilum (strain DSM 1495 / CBS 144.50 / IMI 039719) TaxID=759272 RepID=G0S0J3_CHATD|nr:hypothetical protein CTHT_0010220 [Thermochaetoides thermophila DSM 1495]EGS23354.1 hypothetical protein CTHT_0010220 [Thermochaetoides thermophila DSM 1495]